jgi:hypothetical protein
MVINGRVHNLCWKVFSEDVLKKLSGVKGMLMGVTTLERGATMGFKIPQRDRSAGALVKLADVVEEPRESNPSDSGGRHRLK